ncbi:MAG: DUF433 domain-containing protein [Acidobacteria bacterium]|nr:DUF433 domain-containing protein [Acidobacteriota bacterium]
MQVISTTHIETDEQGVAWIRGANTKVIEVVREKLGGWNPEDIHLDHPHLSLAQIYAALSYYYDNQEAIDVEIARREKAANEMLGKTESRFSRQELLDRAKIKDRKLG